MLIVDAYRDYLLLEKKYSGHTVQAYVSDVERFANFINENFKDFVLEEVNYSMVRSWIVVLIDQGLSNISVNRKVSSLKSFYRFLLKIESVAVSPLSKHRVLKTPRLIQTPYSEKELQLLLDKKMFLDDFSGLRDRLIISFLYETGVRRAELISLKVKDIDFFSLTIKVLGKRGKERIIPILPSLSKTIKVYIECKSQLSVRANSDFLLVTDSGNKLYDMFVYRTINSYLGAVTEKKKKSPHMLRHTFATHMLSSGADLNSVKELLGHSSLASTQVYTHNSLSELKKTYQKSHPRNKNK